MTSKAQRSVCAGLQSAAGTGVNVDTVLRATCSLRPLVDKIHPDEDIASFAPARHYVAAVRPEGSLVLDGTYEQSLVLLAMALGTVTPGAGPPYLWTFDLPDATASLNAFSLWTVEYSDGGNQIIRAEDVFAKSLTISGEAGKQWIFEAELDGGETTIPAAVSASPTLDDTVTAVRMADTTLWIDTTYAGIGVTQSEELISFTWKIEELQHAKQFAGSLYPNGRGNSKYKLSLELVLEMAAAEAHAFSDAALTTTQYAVQVKGLVDANDFIKVNGMYMVEEISALDERDGNNTIKITLLGEKDASDNTGAVLVTTDVAAL
jgi:hypothetical protein